MYKKTMETIDFGGTKRVEDYYFNLTAAELMEMQLSTEGGFKEMIERIVNAQNQTEMTELFKKMICKSYGVLSPDGRKFIKNQAVLEDFLATQAVSQPITIEDCRQFQPLLKRWIVNVIKLFAPLM